MDSAIVTLDNDVSRVQWKQVENNIFLIKKLVRENLWLTPEITSIFSLYFQGRLEVPQRPWKLIFF